jgi:hypothetical protein
MRYVHTAEMGGNMDPVGADAAITDTIPPALATQPDPDRATAGKATTTAAPGGTGQRQDDADTRSRRARLVFTAWLTAAVAAVTVALYARDLSKPHAGVALAALALSSMPAFLSKPGRTSPGVKPGGRGPDYVTTPRPEPSGSGASQPCWPARTST